MRTLAVKFWTTSLIFNRAIQNSQVKMATLNTVPTFNTDFVPQQCEYVKTIISPLDSVFSILVLYLLRHVEYSENHLTYY